MVADSVKAAKPWVKFGISPFGIWQNKSTAQPLGSDTRGLESYSAIYCDSRKWVQEGWIDYIAPQLYWYIGFNVADYAILQSWWTQNAANRHIYIGQAAYRIGADVNWNAAELPRQLRSNRLAPNIQGSIFFRTGNLNLNTLGFRDSLMQNFYQKPALLPNMSWKPSANLSAPTNVNAVANTEGVRISWTRTTSGSTELSKVRGYAIYRFLDNTPVDISKSENLLFVVPTDTTVFVDKNANANGRRQYTYAVTALNRLHDESPVSSTAAVIITNLKESELQNIDIQSVTPNPVATQGSVFYTIKETAHVQLQLLDVTGKTHTQLLNTQQSVGEYSSDFDVSALSNGVYFIKLTAQSLGKNAPAVTLVRKIIVVK
ncbi:MAG: family 10 glycosylhydrolase [Saprospiraceae bacterium]|nr:family 10 glycosylhydrolase [Saprospiraceae bacterium]